MSNLGATRESKYRVILDGEQNQEYNRKWEQKFKWLATSEKGKEHYYCKVCKRDNFGGLRQITLHCTTKTHMKALMSAPVEPATASVYFVGSRRKEPHPKKSYGAPKKRRVSEQPASSENETGSEEGSPQIATSHTSPPKTELIHLKTYTSPVDGKKIVLNMERRLEPINKPRTSIRVKQQAVAPYSRTNETQAAVKTIEQAEAGLLIEEEPVDPVVHSLVHPVVSVKSESATSRKSSAQPSTPSHVPAQVIEQTLDTDAFGVFGKHVANKLRTLPSDQNKFAQKLIMDVLFEGEMESLDRNTKVVKCGVSCVCQQ